MDKEIKKILCKEHKEIDNCKDHKNHKDSIVIDEWDRIDYPVSKVNKTHIEMFDRDFITIDECNDNNNSLVVGTSSFTQTNKDCVCNLSLEMNIMKNEMKKLSEEMKMMRDELKELSTTTMLIKEEVMEHIKDIKTFNERKKNHYIRSNIPFKFIPTNTTGYPVGIFNVL